MNKIPSMGVWVISLKPKIKINIFSTTHELLFKSEIEIF